ncbi:hypothetical protein HZB97_01710 [Candidatus Gottesmanbacteria bacterium]|nr:hypothetical protein [Candidatus Gottesmanbacteria bacterium]
MIIETSATNFGLLSEKEQEALIFAYAGLLNSLTFPLQIVIRSKRKDISSYLKLLDEAKDKQDKEELKQRITRYKEFIIKIIGENNVLDKKFYLVIPFSSLELGIKSAAGGLTGKKGLPFPKNYIFEGAKTALFPKRDHLLRQLTRLGLKGKPLNSQQLIELFHNIYNPEVVGQRLAEKEAYEISLVESKK